MIVYSVTVNVENSMHEDWLAWMKSKHIPDVMETGIFQSHRLLKVISRDQEEEGVTYNIQYTCPSMADLHRYQSNYAPKLQSEHTERYKDKAVAFRTLLEEA